MITISLCMIVKNEENTLAACLHSVRDAVDEIVIVDTGSSDGTKATASRFTDKIFDFEWIDDFAAARNYAYEQATMDYILWLDADDVVLPGDIEKLMRLKEELSPAVDAVRMKYNTLFDADGNVLFSYYRERLTRRGCGFRWREPVHEVLEIWGNVINIDICITHTKRHCALSDRNLKIYEGILARGKTLSPRGTYYYARELSTHKRYAEAVRVFNRFLDEGKGWREDNITACGELAKCLLQLHEDEKALAAMLRSFQFDKPRPELCCQIGYFFKNRNAYELAVFWFSLVLGLEETKEPLGFVQHDCRGYIPCIECAVCYDRLGDYVLAEHYNMKAGELKPDDPAFLSNKKYFKEKQKLPDPK